MQKLEVAHNPLQRPPITVVRQGLAAVRRFFQDLSRSGSLPSRSGRLVLIGPPGGGKTALQRGLCFGIPPANSTVPPPHTVFCDMHHVLLGGEGSATGADQAVLTICDVGGDVKGAGTLATPYLSPGSLYVLCVAAYAIPLPRTMNATATVNAIPTDDAYAEKISEWLTLLQLGAPTAAVIPVLTHCDQLLSPHTHPSPSAMVDAASEHAKWLLKVIEQHQEALRPEAPRLRVQVQPVAQQPNFHNPVVPCVCSVGSGGSSSLEMVRTRIEALVIGYKELKLVPSVGHSLNRGLQIATSLLRALRDGKDPIATAKFVSSGGDPPESVPEHGVVMVMLTEARRKWTEVIAPQSGLGNDETHLFDEAVKLLANQGEICVCNGVLCLDPDLINRMLAPLLDRRLTREWATPRAVEHTGEPSADHPHASLLLAAVDALVGQGELREELLPLLWGPAGFKPDEHSTVLLTLASAGVIFSPSHTGHGRKWVVPTRLPKMGNFAPPAVVEWATSDPPPAMDRLVLSYRLGVAIPPGTAAKLLGSVGAFGRYEHYWRRGALVQSSACGGIPLLMEIRPEPDLRTPEPGQLPTAQRDSKDLSGPHEVTFEVQGTEDEREVLWAVLLQLKQRVDMLMNDTVGLAATSKCELCCPGCIRPPGAEGGVVQAAAAKSAAASPLSKASTKPGQPIPIHKRTRWPVADVTAHALKCEVCGESLSLSHVHGPGSPEKGGGGGYGGFSGSVSGASVSGGSVIGGHGGGSVIGGFGGGGGIDRSLSSFGPGNFHVSSVAASPMAPPLLGVTLEPPVAMQMEMAEAARTPSRTFVEAVYFRMGLPVESGHGLHRMLGVGRKQLKSLLAESDTIVAEVNAAAAAAAAAASAIDDPTPSTPGLVGGLGKISEDGVAAAHSPFVKSSRHSRDSHEGSFAKRPPTHHRDGYGWTEAEWLTYINTKKAGEHGLDATALQTATTGLPLSLPDAAHDAKSLEAFVAHPSALMAGLDRAQVLAIRLYSTGAFHSLSQQLRVGCSTQRPHSHPALVLQVVEALKKLRSAAVNPRPDRIAKAAAKTSAKAAAAAAAAAAKAAAAAAGEGAEASSAAAEAAATASAPAAAAAETDGATPRATPAPTQPLTTPSAAASSKVASTADKATAAAAAPKPVIAPVLWRGVRVPSVQEFVQRGGTESAFCSLTPDRAIAEQQVLDAIAAAEAAAAAEQAASERAAAAAVTTPSSPADGAAESEQNGPSASGSSSGSSARMAGVARPSVGPGVMVLLKVLPADDPLRCAPADISFASVYYSVQGEHPSSHPPSPAPIHPHPAFASTLASSPPLETQRATRVPSVPAQASGCCRPALTCRRPAAEARSLRKRARSLRSSSACRGRLLRGTEVSGGRRCAAT